MYVEVRRAPRLRMVVIVSIAIACLSPGLARAATALTERPGQLGTVQPNQFGVLDCNGLSPIQKPIHTNLACADLHDSTYPDNRFWDNGVYVGHDEPALNFTSSKPGSGNDVSWTFRIGKDPAAPAGYTTPGSDVSHYVELTPAIWFSMNICDPQSYPLLPCTPNSDRNAPLGRYPGGGSAFLELQFYPPGFGPWVDAPSFDNTHWGAALTIDSLEGTQGFTNLNNNCVEPINFSFLQTNGVPPGPPSPQLADLASNEPNTHTLLMNQGDLIRVHIFDAPVPGGGGKAVESVVEDLTTHQTGYMQASAANGFMNTSIADCSGTPFNFEPAYNTAKAGHVTPWGAGTEVISAAVETGHFTPCTSITGPQTLPLPSGASDTYYTTCHGPYEDAAPGGDGGTSPEASDAFCFPAGDTHGGLAAAFPDTITGCEDNFAQNGDLDFDGSAYWSEWPTSTTPNTYPSTFRIMPPTTGSSPTPYSSYQFQTDAAFSETTTCNPGTPQGCAVPPPNAPGQFYPYWSLAGLRPSACAWEFGNVSTGVRTFGKAAQFGGLNPKQFPELASSFYPNHCTN